MPHVVNDPFVIVSEKEAVRVELVDITGTAYDHAIREKAGDQVVNWFAFSHDDNLVAVADSFVGRAVQGDEKATVDRRWRIAAEIIETESGCVSGKECVGGWDAFAVGSALESRVFEDIAVR